MGRNKPARELRWMRLDNAAKIFPAAMRKNWNNAFRISFSFRDPIDPEKLQEAVNAVVLRFPSVSVHLGHSMFWHYLEENAEPPVIREDASQPLLLMTEKETRRCAIRVLYYRNRVAVEFFHAVTDGTGGLIFTKTLAAEYVRRRYNIDVPAEDGILDLNEKPSDEEFEDSFIRYAGPISAPRDPLRVYRPRGILESDLFLHQTCGVLDAGAVLAKARSYGTTVTNYISALLAWSLMELQAQSVPKINRRKPVKVQIPVNLRAKFPSRTMRNFVAVVNVGIDPRMGEWTLEEVIHSIHYQAALGETPKNLQAIFTPNVKGELNPFVKPVPRVLKDMLLRTIFDLVGERVSSICLSNLGNIRLPDAMRPYVERVEFVLSPPSKTPYNCSISSWNGTLFCNLVRNTQSAEFERIFFTNLVKEGLHVRIESNDRQSSVQKGS